MKKKRFLILLLCVSLLTGSFAVPVQALEKADPGVTDTTVESGCRTLDGMVPLAGSQRMLETAQAAFVYEITTGTVVYAYNPDVELYPGSLSKVLTALIAIEMGDLDDEITVSTREISHLPVGAITAKFKEGEVVKLEHVLYALILTSANDAALIIADYIAGGEAAFVEIMNQRAAELGCTNTVFTNCHGLDDAMQHTTARDMAKITLAATQNPVFAEVFKTMKYVIPPTNRSEKERVLESGNHLMYDLVITKYNDSRVTGAMPSYSSATAGASIAFTAEDKGMQLVVVILGATRTFNANGNADYYGNFDESLDLLEFTFSGYKINQILYPGQSFEQFEVKDGECEVVGAPDVSVNTVLPVGAGMDNLILKYSVTDGGIAAPIDAGDVIATVQLWFGPSCLAETELYAMSEVRDMDETGVEIFGASRDDSNTSGFLKFLGIVCLVVFIPLGLYFAYNAYRRAVMRNRRRRRRSSRRRSR